MNSTTGSLEFYDGESWIATNLIPTVNSVTGNIYADYGSTLTLNITNATDSVTVCFSEGGATIADVDSVTVTAGEASVSVPAAVYGQTAGDTIAVSIINEDGTPSNNAISKTVAALPTGGTITTLGDYLIHTFTSSGSFVVQSGVTLTADYLIVAGGGGGGSHVGAGGGAGGLITGSGETIAAGSRSIVVGAGGSVGTNANGSNGGASTLPGYYSADGGGYGPGSGDVYRNGGNGGSGGGGQGHNGSPNTGYATTGGSGISGQGYAGGRGSNYDMGCGGGGGSSAAGGDGDPSNGSGGNGGAGTLWNGETYAGGGGGSTANYQGHAIQGLGAAGGGDGSFYASSDNHGLANRGSGGGGIHASSGAAGNGGSGIVIIRYQL